MSTTSNHRSFIRLFCVVLFGLFISGCQMVKGQVSSFSSLSPTTSGEPFFVLPTEVQSTSAEFNQYANSVARRLSRKGWYRVMDANQARYVVLLDYGVAASSKNTGSVPVYGQTGGGTTTHSGTYNTYGGGYGSYSGTSYTMPTWGVVGSQSYSYTTYQRYFQMKVIDTTNETAVYETKAASEGTSSNLFRVYF